MFIINNVNRNLRALTFNFMIRRKARK